MVTERELRKFLRSNFPFALIPGNDAKFSGNDLKTAERCFTEKDLKRFKNPEYILSGVACLIKNVLAVKSDFKSQVKQGKGEQWKEYHRSLPEVKKLIRLFLDNRVNEIVFKTSTKEKSVIKGPLLSDIKGYFLDLFVAEDYDNEIHYEQLALQDNDSPLIKNMKIQREAITEKKKLTNLKYNTAYHLNEFLNRLSPGKNEMIIGKFLYEADLFTYSGSRDHTNITKFITRGRELNP
ncbi:MAG: hypothetical protein JNK14_09085 [Chitinophagaceae bacterium]|nr:hypothetical protein [Chitinophagaceae bacterium]